jgi:16S rRNA (adenine1518-N6/adenine1519-N6)-dimethyltransferase
MPTKLGQNFLTDSTIAEKIVGSANLSKDDNVFEIGPGAGALTRLLSQKAGKVLAIEIDKALIAPLKKELEDQKNSKIIADDILKINLPNLLEENNFQKYKVVANLPYYITSKIIRLLLETKYPPAEMVLMVQKEVGERICAPSGKESLLSISVKFYAEPEILFFVPREKFEPAPEVDSAVIRIKRKNDIPEIDIKKFFAFVRAGFSSRRKMLVNNLSTSFHIPKTDVSEIIKKAGVEPTQRAQELEVRDWLRLYDNFEF